MGCCPGSCHESCPETTPVTILQTNLYFDGTNFFFNEARYSKSGGSVTLDSSGEYKVITLAYNPLSNASVTGFRNSAAMRNGADYIVSGKQVYLVNPALDDEEFYFKYPSMEGPVGGATYSVGYMQPYYTDPGAGWLEMDGTTSHLKTTYASLWVFLSLNSELLLSSTSTHFVLKELTAPLYNGSTLFPAAAMYIKI